MNEAHDGWKRCIRTRQVGQRILPVAHRAGVRHLAMEALHPNFAKKCNSNRRVPDEETGYLSQPEMKEFIQTALDLGWTLIPYEANSLQWLSNKYNIVFQNPNDPQEPFDQHQKFQADLMSMEFSNWREEQQALNLIAALQSLPTGTPMLVWCGNGHNAKMVIEDWKPTGYQFQRHSVINPFVIDQTRTVNFDSGETRVETELAVQFVDQLTKHGGTAGFITEEAPSIFGDDEIADALLRSTQNELE